MAPSNMPSFSYSPNMQCPTSFLNPENKLETETTSFQSLAMIPLTLNPSTALLLGLSATTKLTLLNMVLFHPDSAKMPTKRRFNSCLLNPTTQILDQTLKKKSSPSKSNSWPVPLRCNAVILWVMRLFRVVHRFWASLKHLLMNFTYFDSYGLWPGVLGLWWTMLQPWMPT